MSESIWRRIELSQMAWQMTKNSPLFGVGFGNFLQKLPEFLLPRQFYFWQPVHNIFLLILAETGIILLCLMFYGLWRIFKKLWQEKNWPLSYALLAVVLTGLLDHYWLTLQQGQLLLALLLGFNLKFSINRKNK